MGDNVTCPECGSDVRTLETVGECKECDWWGEIPHGIDKYDELAKRQVDLLNESIKSAYYSVFDKETMTNTPQQEDNHPELSQHLQHDESNIILQSVRGVKLYYVESGIKHDGEEYRAMDIAFDKDGPNRMSDDTIKRSIRESEKHVRYVIRRSIERMG